MTDTMTVAASEDWLADHYADHITAQAARLGINLHFPHGALPGSAARTLISGSLADEQLLMKAIGDHADVDELGCAWEAPGRSGVRSLLVGLLLRRPVARIVPIGDLRLVAEALDRAVEDEASLSVRRMVLAEAGWWAGLLVLAVGFVAAVAAPDVLVGSGWSLVAAALLFGVAIVSDKLERLEDARRVVSRLRRERALAGVR